MLKLAIETVGKIGFRPIESKISVSTVHNNGDEEVAAFIRVMKSLLVLDPNRRPSAMEALRDPIFQQL